MSQGPHVLILPSWYPTHASDSGGIFFREQAIALARAGLRVGVIAPQRLPPKELLRRRAPISPYALLNEILARYVGVPRSQNLDAFPWRFTARRLYRTYVARHGTPDIVHAHSLFPAGLLAPHLPARAHLLTEHSTGFLSPGARALLEPHSATLRRFARRIAVSQHFGRHLEDLAPQGGPWSYVPNLVDTSFFAPRSSGDGVLRVLSVSNLVRTKRVDVLMQAFDRAFSNSDAQLVIGGRGEARAELEILAGKLSSGPRIRFLGPLTREQVRDQLDQCSFFALASRYETFGVVLIEALAMGKPVIATDSGGPTSIVDARNGLLVPPDDVKALADAMVEMAARRRTYSSKALRADCVDRFGEQAVVAQLRRQYDEVLSLGG